MAYSSLNVHTHSGFTVQCTPLKKYSNIFYSFLPFLWIFEGFYSVRWFAVSDKTKRFIFCVSFSRYLDRARNKKREQEKGAQKHPHYTICNALCVKSNKNITQEYTRNWILGYRIFLLYFTCLRCRRLDRGKANKNNILLAATTGDCEK